MPDSRTISLEELLARRADVRRVVRFLARNEEEALDLEQEGWLRLMQRPPTTRENPVGWFRQVVRRLAIDRDRKARRVETTPRVPERDEPAEPTDELVARLELDQRVGQAVLDLPAKYREVIVLGFWDGLGPSEIAKRLGRPVESVRTQLRRALDRLRERLDRDYGDRGAWVALAGASKAVPAAGAAIGGITLVTVMKKLAIVAGALLVAFVARRALEERARPDRTELPVAEVAGVQESSGLEAAEREPERAEIESGNGERVRVDAVGEPSSGSVVTGRVVDESSAPLVGVEVELGSWDPWSFERRVWKDEFVHVADRVRTDALGEFRLEVPGPPRSDPFLRFVGSDHHERRIIAFRPAAEAFEPESARGQERFEPFAAGTQHVGDVVLRGASAIRLARARGDG